jgi:hypothetical protein
LRTDRAYVFLILIAVVGVLSAYYHATDITPRLFGFEPYSDIMEFYAESVEPGMPYVDKLIDYPSGMEQPPPAHMDSWTEMPALSQTYEWAERTLKM